MKAIKITNPEYLGLLAEPIQKFVEKIDVAGIRYETLYTYFVESIRSGMIQKQIHGFELEEFWVVIDEEKPIAFGHWFKRGVPYVAAIDFDFIYSWDNKREAFGMLIDEMLNFSIRHRSPQIVGTAINSIVFNHLVKVGKQKGVEVINSKSINFSARKR